VFLDVFKKTALPVAEVLNEHGEFVLTFSPVPVKVDGLHGEIRVECGRMHDHASPNCVTRVHQAGTSTVTGTRSEFLKRMGQKEVI